MEEYEVEFVKRIEESKKILESSLERSQMLIDEDIKQELEEIRKAVEKMIKNPDRPKRVSDSEEGWIKEDIPFLEYYKKVYKLLSRSSDLDSYWKDSSNNSNEREVGRKNKLISILKFEVRVKNNYYGVIINDKFIVSLSKNNWKIKGSKWQRHGELADFIKGTVLGQSVDGWDAKKGRKSRKGRKK